MKGRYWACIVGVVACLYVTLRSFFSSPPALRMEWDVLFVTDKDHLSRHPSTFEWAAGITVATLRLDPVAFTFSLQFNQTLSISSQVAYANRSMELSAMEFFRGHLMAFCDRSGIQFYLDLFRRQGYVKTMIRNGDGLQVTPFKTEWATIKDDHLFVGGTGKEWTTAENVVLNEHMKWVKQIDQDGRIINVNWKYVYDKLREISNTSYPGYIVHESVSFNHRRRQWVFVPRRMSTLPYSDPIDIRMGANTLFLVSEDFRKIEMRTVGPLETDWGFTCIKPILFSNEYLAAHPELLDYYLGIKAKESLNENGESIHEGSKLVVFDLEGNLHSEFHTLHDTDKYEGIAFLPGELSFSELLEWQRSHAFGAYPSSSHLAVDGL